MSNIHAEMSPWRIHLRKCNAEDLIRKICISCKGSKEEKDKLCFECTLAESEWSEESA